MIGIFGALVAASSWGVADVLAAHACKRRNAIAVTFWKNVVQSLAIGLVVIASDPVFRVGSLLLAGLAGAIIGAALALFYWALAKGNVSITAAVSGAVLAAVPALYGYVRGEILSTLQIVGILICVMSVVLSSIDRREHIDKKHIVRSIAIGCVVGLGAAVFFIIIGTIPEEQGFAPLLASNIGASLVLLILAVVTKTAIGSRDVATSGVLPGLVDCVGQGGFYFATHSTYLAVAAVISSMAPAVVIGIAIVIFHERPSLPQKIGMAASLLGVGILSAVS